MDIEQLAVERPEALARVAVDPNVGIDDAKAHEIVDGGRLRRRDRREDRAGPADPVDASTATRTPRSSRSTRWCRTADGEIVALDGKVTLDANAFFRHPEHEALEDTAETDPLEMAAKEKDLNYVKLDGSVGIIGNGAGLVMSTLDVVAYAGEEFGGQKPANFLDIGGGASAEVMADGLHIILSDPQVKSVFVNVFGGITACDAVANGIVGALDALGDEEDRPLVVRLDGNNVEEGRRILAERNHPRVIIEETMDGAARKAAELASAQLTPEREERHDTHGHLPHRRLQGHRPGHDRLRGHEAHAADAALRHRRSSAASTPARPARPSSSRAAPPCPSSAPSPRRWRRPAPT